MSKTIPYQYKAADRAIRLLNKRAVRRFSDTKSQLSLLKFDELTVIRLIKSLYEQLEADNQEVFLDLAQMVYERTMKDLDEKQFLEEVTELWLLDFLSQDSPVTKYIYAHEVTRKREYVTEAVNAAPDKATEMDKGLIKWSRFTGWYADLVADEAAMKAFKDSGVRRVRWNTEHDDRVCDVCGPLDGKIFDIDKAPPKQHPGCRCYYTAVI